MEDPFPGKALLSDSRGKETFCDEQSNGGIH
jgi:hypothetical protein